MIVVVLIALMIIDDLVFSAYLSDINNYLVIDYAKKTLLLVACFSTASFRRSVTQAFGVPDIPWAGTGWFNPHLLILIAGALLLDQGITWLDLHGNRLAGNPVYQHVPPYHDDLIKYFDLTFGLLWNAVAEETFYRAVLITMLYGLLPRTLPCILIAGILFGLAHWSQGPVSVGAIIIGGWILGMLYCVTGSIVPGIIVHYISNLIAFTP